MDETELLVKISNMLLDYARENNVEVSKQQMSKLLKSVCNVFCKKIQPHEILIRTACFSAKKQVQM